MLGKDGESVRVSGAPVEKEVVDTTGAGDAFVGSLAFFLACRCLSHTATPPNLTLIAKAKPDSGGGRAQELQSRFYNCAEARNAGELS